MKTYCLFYCGGGEPNCLSGVDQMQADVEEDLLKFLRNVYLILNEIDDDSLVAEFAQYWPALIKEAKIQKGPETTSKV